MKILITGGTGLVGYGIRKVVEKKSEKENVSNKGIKNEYIFLSSKDCDLTSYWETKRFFDKTRPDFVIHLAACVGGLFKNMNQKVEMFEKNMKLNVIRVDAEEFFLERLSGISDPEQKRIIIRFIFRYKASLSL